MTEKRWYLRETWQKRYFWGNNERKKISKRNLKEGYIKGKLDRKKVILKKILTKEDDFYENSERNAMWEENLRERGQLWENSVRNKETY